MSKKARYTIWIILLSFPWLSQALFPDNPIWEPITWTVFILAIILVIEKWGKP